VEVLFLVVNSYLVEIIENHDFSKIYSYQNVLSKGIRNVSLDQPRAYCDSESVQELEKGRQQGKCAVET